MKNLSQLSILILLLQVSCAESPVDETSNRDDNQGYHLDMNGPTGFDEAPNEDLLKLENYRNNFTVSMHRTELLGTIWWNNSLLPAESYHFQGTMREGAVYVSHQYMKTQPLKLTDILVKDTTSSIYNNNHLNKLHSLRYEIDQTKLQLNVPKAATYIDIIFDTFVTEEFGSKHRSCQRQFTKRYPITDESILIFRILESETTTWEHNNGYECTGENEL